MPWRLASGEWLFLLVTDCFVVDWLFCWWLTSSTLVYCSSVAIYSLARCMVYYTTQRLTVCQRRLTVGRQWLTVNRRRLTVSRRRLTVSRRRLIVRWRCLTVSRRRVTVLSAMVDCSSATIDFVVLIVIPELQYMYVNAMFHNVQGT